MRKLNIEIGTSSMRAFQSVGLSQHLRCLEIGVIVFAGLVFSVVTAGANQSCDHRCAGQNDGGLCRAACLADRSGNAGYSSSGTDLQSMQIIASSREGTMLSVVLTTGELAFLNIPFALEDPGFREEFRKQIVAQGTKTVTEQSLWSVVRKLIFDNVIERNLENGTATEFSCQDGNCAAEAAAFGVRD